MTAELSKATVASTEIATSCDKGCWQRNSSVHNRSPLQLQCMRLDAWTISCVLYAS